MKNCLRDIGDLSEVGFPSKRGVPQRSGGKGVFPSARGPCRRGSPQIRGRQGGVCSHAGPLGDTGRGRTAEAPGAGHRKRGPARRRPLTHQVARRPRRRPPGPGTVSAARPGRVRSPPTAAVPSGGARGDGGAGGRTTDDRPTDDAGDGGARARAGALTPGGRSRRAALGAAARSRGSVSH